MTFDNWVNLFTAIGTCCASGFAALGVWYNWWDSQVHVKAKAQVEVYSTGYSDVEIVVIRVTNLGKVPIKLNENFFSWVVPRSDLMLLGIPKNIPQIQVNFPTTLSSRTTGIFPMGSVNDMAMTLMKLIEDDKLNFKQISNFEARGIADDYTSFKIRVDKGLGKNLAQLSKDLKGQLLLINDEKP